MREQAICPVTDRVVWVTLRNKYTESDWYDNRIVDSGENLYHQVQQNSRVFLFSEVIASQQMRDTFDSQEELVVLVLA